MHKTLRLIIFIIFYTPIVSFSQEIIYIQNPSFESKNAKLYSPPGGWFDCGFPNETPVDIHGKNTGFYGINKTPSDGNYFVGMTTRTNETWECMGQILSSPLHKGKKYQFCIDLCKAPNLESIDRKTITVANYNTPISFRIQGSNNTTGINEILVTSKLIENENWEKYEFVLEPQNEYDIIIFEACHENPKKNGYVNGNIMLDNCSRIEEIIN